MINASDDLCLICEHPKSEHVEGGCDHLTRVANPGHDNPENKRCDCRGFRGTRKQEP